MNETTKLLRSAANAERLLASIAQIKSGKAAVRNLISPSDIKDGVGLGSPDGICAA